VAVSAELSRPARVRLNVAGRNEKRLQRGANYGAAGDLCDLGGDSTGGVERELHAAFVARADDGAIQASHAPDTW